MLPFTTLITPTLIPLALNKKRSEAFLSVQDWYTFLHERKELVMLTYKELCKDSLPEKAPVPQPYTSIKESITCHPHSTLPLLGTHFPPKDYTPLAQANEKSQHIWVNCSTPYPFYWDRKLIIPIETEKPQNRLSLEKSFAFSQGDYVVHIEYGLGRFQGIECFSDKGKSVDCLRIVYANNTIVYIPAIDAHSLHFFADKDEDIVLSDISKKKWLLSKSAHTKDIEKFACNLLDVATNRALLGAPSIMTDHSILERFAQFFPHTLTQDQQKTLNSIITDLTRSIPMNRLLCADVAFGKTEVSMRAAFITAIQGWQVLIISPSTLLCLQHFERYKDRFSEFGLNCSMLSKLTPTKEKVHIKEKLKASKVDILFTTHAAFHESVNLPHLGLCIVDEEHLFGVAQKESIKERYPNAHLLSLSATPIPRTLHMALSSIQDISTIQTPPGTMQKKPVFVQTHVNAPSFVKQYTQERLEYGQIFFVVPHIKNLVFYENVIKECGRYTVLTGKSSPKQIRTHLSAFLKKEIPILLSTNIVGLGMDVPDVNTLIVADAHLFGLSQLYQLRGRVGRHTHTGAVMLLHPPKHALTPNAQKRISYIEEHTQLGSHMAIARLDMQMRGSGRLIGKEQAGHYFNLGPSLYQTLLAQSIQKARLGKKTLPALAQQAPEVSFPYPARITQEYISDAHNRINLYRLTTRAKSLKELAELKGECDALYGAENKEACNWFILMRLKNYAQTYAIRKLGVSTTGLTIIWMPHAAFLKKSTESIIAILEHPHIRPAGEDGLRFNTLITHPNQAEEAFLQLMDILKITEQTP